MFSRNDKSKTATDVAGGQQVKTKVPSIMGPDLVVTGNIVSDGEVQIDGEVIGDIKGNVVLVGGSAKIKGEIYADTIHIHGNINGQIKAKTVHMAKTAHVVGDILHENLSIDEGAFIEGHITHMTEMPSSISDDRVNLVVNKNPAQRGAQVPANAPTKPAAQTPADKKTASAN